MPWAPPMCVRAVCCVCKGVCEKKVGGAQHPPPSLCGECCLWEEPNTACSNSTQNGSAPSAPANR
eukprot:1478569-Prymnesium_polylepis.1